MAIIGCAVVPDLPTLLVQELNDSIVSMYCNYKFVFPLSAAVTLLRYLFLSPSTEGDKEVKG